MNPFRTGKLVLFQVSYNRDWHFFEIGFFILIGAFGVNVKPSVFRSLLPELARTGRACMVLL